MLMKAEMTWNDYGSKVDCNPQNMIGLDIEYLIFAIPIENSWKGALKVAADR